MFDADRPIIKSEQDRLNRVLFAKYLARCLLDHKSPESLVVALNGGFGVGKTSLLNLVSEELHYAASNMWDNEKPVFFIFNPWIYSGQHDLFSQFFTKLRDIVKSHQYLENANRIIHLLELYISFFSHEPIVTSSQTPHSFLSELTEDSNNVYGWTECKDLTPVKQELNRLLAQQKHKIIILIDNISQLYNHEIKQIFQLIKSIANFANTIYLLAYDNQQVIRVLNKLDGRNDSEKFIDKIVQLSFEVPEISKQELETLLADRLLRMMKAVPDEAWDADYWGDIYHHSLKYFFHTSRDITRYVNTLNFSYPRLSDVVNPVDFFALTAIEVFLPKIYTGIRDNKDLFTDLLDNVYEMNEELRAQDKSRCDEILARNNYVSKDALLQLIMRLFPRIRQLYEPNNIFFHSEATARKLRRICSPDMFDVYFRLSLQEMSFTNREFNEILVQANHAEEFDHALTRLNQDDRVLVFLNHLDNISVLQNIPKENIPAIINALIDNGDLFPQGIPGPLSIDTQTRLHRIIHGLLRRFDSFEERFLILQNAIANATKSIYTSVHELQEQGREHTEEENRFLPMQFRDLTSEQLEVLRKLTVSRIEQWAHNGSLVDHPQLLAILYAWHEWGNKEYCEQFVKAITQTDRGLIAFLTAALDQPIDQAMKNYRKSPEWEKHLDKINIFLSAHSLEKHAKELFEDQYFEKLREREQLSLMIFLDLMKVPTKKVIPKTGV